jgi:hypothetical protein
MTDLTTTDSLFDAAAAKLGYNDTHGLRFLDEGPFSNSAVQVTNQRQLDWVLDNLPTVEQISLTSRDNSPSGRVQYALERHVPRTTTVRVDHNADLTSTRSDVPVVVNRGRYHVLDHRPVTWVTVNSGGSVHVPRGSTVRATGGHVTVDSWPQDNLAGRVYAYGTAQVTTSSGKVIGKDNTKITASGDAFVLLRDDAELDASDTVTFQSEDRSRVRAKGRVIGTVRHRSFCTAGDDCRISLVSPEAKAYLADNAELSVAQGIPSTAYTTDNPITWLPALSGISPEERAYRAGRAEFLDGGMLPMPELNTTVEHESRTLDDADVEKVRVAFLKGWEDASNETAAAQEIGVEHKEPYYPLHEDEKVAVIPPTDEADTSTLVKLTRRDGAVTALQSFDWIKGKWGQSCAVAAGPGKALLRELESVKSVARQVPEEVAARYGHLTSRCLMCGRPLHDGDSVKAGYGPECLNKLA